MLNIFADFETALYFSTITFSMVGYGDIVPAHARRIQTALEGVNGFPAHRLVDSLSDRIRHPHEPFKAGEHFRQQQMLRFAPDQ